MMSSTGLVLLWKLRSVHSRRTELNRTQLQLSYYYYYYYF